jgi:glucokinase
LNETSSYPRLVGDIGGTNARFAWLAAPGDTPAQVATYPAADHATLADAMRHYLDAHGLETPHWGAIGIANPVTGDRVQMTNHHWSFSIAQVQRQFGLARFLVLNDFTALALALPVLPAGDLRQVGPGQAVAGAPIALIGPGTGLGVSGLLPIAGGRGEVPVNGEGGHVTLSARDEQEAEVIGVLERRFGHASAERALSGPGLANLHAALCELDGVAVAGLDAAQVTAAALDGSDARCGRAVDLFLALLGTVAGNLALTLGARGGVYLGGGILPRLGGRIETSAFRARFESKGRFAAYLRAMPTWVVHASNSPALLGAARALDVM